MSEQHSKFTCWKVFLFISNVKHCLKKFGKKPSSWNRYGARHAHYQNMYNFDVLQHGGCKNMQNMRTPEFCRNSCDQRKEEIEPLHRKSSVLIGLARLWHSPDWFFCVTFRDFFGLLKNLCCRQSLTAQFLCRKSLTDLAVASFFPSQGYIHRILHKAE